MNPYIDIKWLSKFAPGYSCLRETSSDTVAYLPTLTQTDFVDQNDYNQKSMCLRMWIGADNVVHNHHTTFKGKIGIIKIRDTSFQLEFNWGIF